MGGAVPSELFAAYRDSHYRVHSADGEIAFRVDLPSEGLAALLARHGCASAALITAANPRSRPCSAEENQRRNASLRAELLPVAHAVLEATGSSPDGSWSERSWFAIGVDPQRARELARHYQQNGILLVDDTGIARLEITAGPG